MMQNQGKFTAPSKSKSDELDKNTTSIPTNPSSSGGTSSNEQRIKRMMSILMREYFQSSSKRKVTSGASRSDVLQSQAEVSSRLTQKAIMSYREESSPHNDHAISISSAKRALLTTAQELVREGKRDPSVVTEVLELADAFASYSFIQKSPEIFTLFSLLSSASDINARPEGELADIDSQEADSKSTPPTVSISKALLRTMTMTGIASTKSQLASPGAIHSKPQQHISPSVVPATSNTFPESLSVSRLPMTALSTLKSESSAPSSALPLPLPLSSSLSSSSPFVPSLSSPIVVSEKDLLHDLLYVMQGVDGRFLVKDSETGIFKLQSMIKVTTPPSSKSHTYVSLLIPESQRYLAEKIAITGYYYNIIISSLHDKPHVPITRSNANLQVGSHTSQTSTQGGTQSLTRQAFTNAVLTELRSYRRTLSSFIASLSSSAPAPISTSNVSTSSTSSPLTLRRLYAWAIEPTEVLFSLSQTTSLARGLEGISLLNSLSTLLPSLGLISTSHSSLSSTSPSAQLLTRVIGLSSRPFLSHLQHLLRTGEPLDPFHEFFIAESEEFRRVLRMRGVSTSSASIVTPATSTTFGNSTIPSVSSAAMSGVSHLNDIRQLAIEGVSFSFLWQKRLVILPDRVPSFFPRAIVSDILQAARSAFLHRLITALYPMPISQTQKAGSPTLNLNRMYLFLQSYAFASSVAGLSNSPQSASSSFPSTSTYPSPLLHIPRPLTIEAFAVYARQCNDGVVLQDMLQNCHFFSHVRNLRKYLLLTDAMFATELISQANFVLSQPASAVSHISALNAVEGALSATQPQQPQSTMAHRLAQVSTATASIPLNAISFDELTHRLSIRFIKSAANTPQAAQEKGWDVFCLDYTVTDSPVSIMLPPALIDKYVQCFRLMWKLRRAQISLTNCSADLSSFSTLLRRLASRANTSTSYASYISPRAGEGGRGSTTERRSFGSSASSSTSLKAETPSSGTMFRPRYSFGATGTSTGANANTANTTSTTSGIVRFSATDFLAKTIGSAAAIGSIIPSFRKLLRKCFSARHQLLQYTNSMLLYAEAQTLLVFEPFDTWQSSVFLPNTGPMVGFRSLEEVLSTHLSLMDTLLSSLFLTGSASGSILSCCNRMLELSLQYAGLQARISQVLSAEFNALHAAETEISDIYDDLILEFKLDYEVAEGIKTTGTTSMSTGTLGRNTIRTTAALSINKLPLAAQEHISKQAIEALRAHPTVLEIVDEQQSRHETLNATVQLCLTQLQKVRSTGNRLLVLFKQALHVSHQTSTGASSGSTDETFARTRIGDDGSLNTLFESFQFVMPEEEDIEKGEGKIGMGEAEQNITSEFDSVMFQSSFPLPPALDYGYLAGAAFYENASAMNCFSPEQQTLVLSVNEQGIGSSRETDNDTREVIKEYVSHSTAVSMASVVENITGGGPPEGSNALLIPFQKGFHPSELDMKAVTEEQIELRKIQHLPNTREQDESNDDIDDGDDDEDGDSGKKRADWEVFFNTEKDQFNKIGLSEANLITPEMLENMESLWTRLNFNGYFDTHMN